jgi:hypothetical protein
MGTTVPGSNFLLDIAGVVTVDTSAEQTPCGMTREKPLQDTGVISIVSHFRSSDP